MIKKVEGFIISEVAYGDTSKIINIITPEGIKGIMCKGAKSIKSKNRATTLKFTYGYFNIYDKENKMGTLIDVEVIDSLKNIRNDILLISILNYLTELTSQVVKDNDANQIYPLFISAIKKIEAKLNPIVIMNIIEVKYLDFLGVQINLDTCNVCGTNKNIVTINPDIGGLVCRNCYRNESLVDLNLIRLIRSYYYVNLNKIEKLAIDETLIIAINDFLDSFYERYTGLYLHSKKFLRTLIK